MTWLQRRLRWRPKTTRSVIAWQIVGGLAAFAVAFGLRAGTGEPVARSLLDAAVLAGVWVVVSIPFAIMRMRRDS